MADPVNSRVRKRRKPTRNPAEAAVEPPRAERTSATVIPQENAMDLWLREELRRLYAHVLDDPLPPALVELLWAYETYEGLNNSRSKATGRKH
jgi:hypothetical protein